MKLDPLKNPFIWGGILTVTVVLLWIAAQALWLAVPMIVAGIIYYTVMPLVYFFKTLHLFDQHPISHKQAVWFALLVLVLVGVGLVPVVAPKIGIWGQSLESGIPRYVDGGFDMVARLLKATEERFRWAQDAELLFSWSEITRTLRLDFGKKYLPDFLLGTVHWIAPMMLAPFVAFFALMEGGSFKRNLLQAIPNAYFEKTLYLLHEVDSQIKKYFRGMFWWTLVVTLLLGIGLSFIGVPNPFLLALISTVIAWVPYLGALAGCLVIVLVAATDMPSVPHAPYLVIVLFVTVRVIDDFFIIPNTLGRSLHIHPLPSVLIIFLAGELAGVAGMLLAMPVLGIVMVVTEVAARVLADTSLHARYTQSRRRQVERAHSALR